VDEFTVTGRQDRLDGAVALFDDALVDLPHSPERTRVLANRGAALWYRWQISSQPDDLDRVVEAFRDVVRLTPSGDAVRAVRLNNLAVTLVERLAYTPGPDDADQACAAFDAATSPATSADALWGLRAAREWGRWAESRGDWSEAAVAYHRAH